MAIRFRPKDGILIDIIPFYYKSKYHLFYLKGYGDDSGWPRWQTSWAHLVSKDLLTWEELPSSLETGLKTEPDGGACFTGSVIEKDGNCHIFYTGFNPGFAEGREHIMHAISGDCVTFIKDSNNPVLKIDQKYYGSGEDWRDPFVFWNDEEKCYWMTITAGEAKPICGIKRGVIGLAKSLDLVEWTVHEPIFAPKNYPSLECSDLFRIGEWWYLLFSQYGYTEYRFSKSPYGPWLRPTNPLLDGGEGFFYAAKTLFDGVRRLIFGWCGTLDGNVDRNSGQWGGDMVSPRELVQGVNGELEVKCPKEISSSYINVENSFNPLVGDWDIITATNISSKSCTGFCAGLFEKELKSGMLNFKVIPDRMCGRAGIILNANENLSKYYLIALDFSLNHIQIIRCNSKESVYGDLQEGIRIIAQHFVTFGSLSKEIEISMLYEENILEVFVGQKAVVTARLNDIKGDRIGLFSEDAGVTFMDIIVD